MEISDAGVAVLGEREGCRLTAYYDSVGVLTIGYGHVTPPPEVYEGMIITDEEALAIFDADLDRYEGTVNEAITEPMAQNEFDAFTSICFNIGQSGFAGSTFVERFNQGDKSGCAEAIGWWDQPSEIIPRRNGEVVQFLGGYVPRVQQL